MVIYFLNLSFLENQERTASQHSLLHSADFNSKKKIKKKCYKKREYLADERKGQSPYQHNGKIKRSEDEF